MARVLPSFLFGAVASLLAASSPTHASPAASGGEPQLPSPCLAPTALGRIACELQRAVPTLDGVTVVSRPLDGAPEGSDVRGVAAVLSRLTAARVQGQDGGVARGLPDAILRSKTARLLWLQPKLNGDQLAVTADVFATERSFWEKVKQAAPGPQQHAFANARIDVEIRSYFPKIQLVATRIRKAISPTPHPLALACGDVDGDGSLELAVAGRHRLHIGKIRDGAFQSRTSLRWSDISPVAPTPLRQPLVTLWMQDGAGLRFGSSDRRKLGVLSERFETSTGGEDLLPWPGLGCVQRRDMGLDSRIVDCQTGEAAESLPPTQAPLDTLAGDVLTARDGSTNTVAAARAIGAPELHLFDERGQAAVIADAGAQAAVGDLDLDGYAEIAVSRDTLEPKSDSLRVFTWQPPNVEPRFELSVPGGVDAIALCPVEGPDQGPAVIATGKQLWVVQ